MAEFFVGLFFLTIFGVAAIGILQFIIGIFIPCPDCELRPYYTWQEFLGNYIDEKRGVRQPKKKAPDYPSRRRDQASIETWKAGEDY